MDLKIDSITGMPGMYDNFSSATRNPVILIIFFVVIIMYFFVFASLGSENTARPNDTSGTIAFFQVMVWAIFIILLMLNGVNYFFDIDISASIKNLFTGTPEVDISVDIPEGKTIPEILPQKEVFHIPGNIYTYDNAKAVCKAYNSKLADYNQIEDAYRNGGEWCSYGWSKDQMAYFPTQKDTYDKLKQKPGHENDCGRPGVNGGYIENPNVRFGVNCYGHKPKINELEKKIMDTMPVTPVTKEDLEFEARVNYFKSQLPNMLISPFSKGRWSRI